MHQITGYEPLTGLMSYRTSGNGGSTTNLQNLSYEWDLNGNLTARFDHNQTGTCTGAALCEQFSYDALNRLYHSTRSGVTNLDVTFDAIGNILSRSDVGTYTYDSIKKHAVTSAGANTYGYDANGNRTSWTGATTSWYSYNLPQTISNGTYSSTFYYGADGNRWKQQATYSGGSETTVYAGGLLEKVTVSSGTAYRHYIQAGDNTIVYTRWSTGANPTYYVTTDHLGSSSAITDGSGALVVRESFAAYGARRGSTWSGPPSAPDMTAIANATRQGFTGHEMLDNLGLIHMNGRVYDPAIGRFLSADPFMDFGTGGQATNRFAYVGNNPLAFTDPTGYDADESNPYSCERFTIESTANGFTVTDTLAGQLTSHDAWHTCFPALFPYATGRSVFTSSYVGAGVPTLESLGPTPDYEGGAGGGTSWWRSALDWLGTSLTDSFPRYVHLPYGGVLYSPDGREITWDEPLTRGEFIGGAAGTLGAFGTLPRAASVLTRGATAASSTAFRILEQEGNVIIGSFNGAAGEARVITELVRQGDTLILRGTHIEGSGTLREALSVARQFGRDQGVKRVIVEGGRRSTGANPGHIPRPITVETGL